MIQLFSVSTVDHHATQNSVKLKYIIPLQPQFLIRFKAFLEYKLVNKQIFMSIFLKAGPEISELSYRSCCQSDCTLSCPPEEMNRCPLLSDILPQFIHGNVSCALLQPLCGL